MARGAWIPLNEVLLSEAGVGVKIPQRSLALEGECVQKATRLGQIVGGMHTETHLNSLHFHHAA
jgi:hypothetical protein